MTVSQKPSVKGLVLFKAGHCSLSLRHAGGVPGEDPVPLSPPRPVRALEIPPSHVGAAANVLTLSVLGLLESRS